MALGDLRGTESLHRLLKKNRTREEETPCEPVRLFFLFRIAREKAQITNAFDPASVVSEN
jgi:hypothetical protein